MLDTVGDEYLRAVSSFRVETAVCSMAIQAFVVQILTATPLLLAQVQSEVTEIQGARATVVASILGVRLSSQKHSFAKMRFLQEGGDNEGVPRQLVCPITHELMQEPVVAEDGHTYEKAAIVEWFRNRNSSPMTNEHLKSTQVIPNVLVHAIISDYKESKKEAAPP